MHLTIIPGLALSRAARLRRVGEFREHHWRSTSILTGGILVAWLASFPASSLAQDQNPGENVSSDEISDEIVVTGSPLTRSVDEAITGMSVLSGDELSLRLAGTIGETLKSEPGVSSTFFGAGASRPIIRGQGGDRVRVLNNGIGSIDASSSSPDHAVAAEPAQAERIEVLRGASLLRYGSSGSGGVVNVLDGRIPDALPETVEYNFRVGATSVDDGWEAAGAINTAIGDRLVIHIDGTAREARDYDIPGFAESEGLRAMEEEDHEEEEEEEEEEAFGTLPNSFAESYSASGGLSYILDQGFFGAAVHTFHSTYGVPGGHGHGHADEEHDDDHDDDDHDDEDHAEEEESVSIELDQTRLDINGALNLSGPIERLQLFAGYADYEHTEFEGPGEIGTVFTNEGYEARLEAIQAERDDWKAAYGLQIRSRDFAAIGEEAFVPPTLTEQIGVYMFHEKEIDQAHLEGAVRYEHTRQEDARGADERGFDLISLSAGGDVHFNENTRFGGSVFRTERAPTTEELFSNGPHLATGRFESGDSRLGKETALGGEIVLRHNAESAFIVTNVFYTDYQDYILARATGDEEDELPVSQYSPTDAQFYGFEIQGGVKLGSVGNFALKADALAEYVRATSDFGSLPRIPPLSILAGFEAESPQLMLRMEYDYAASQSKHTLFELPTDSYGLVNLFVNWRIFADERPLSLNISALNLFDEEARQHASFLKDQVPLPGRNFRIALTHRFK